MENVNCPFCQQSLDDLRISEREHHVFGCIGNTSPVIQSTRKRVNSSIAKSSDKQRSPRTCTICSKVIKGTLKTRQTHLVRCARRAKLPESERMKLVRSERNFSSDSEPEFVNPKKPRSNILHIEQPQTVNDADVQLAIAMSNSDAERKARNKSIIIKAHNDLVEQRSASSSDMNMTVYNEVSFRHPDLVRNNNIFAEDYSCNLLTVSQQEPITSPICKRSSEQDESFDFLNSTKKRKLDPPDDPLMHPSIPKEPTPQKPLANWNSPVNLSDDRMETQSSADASLFNQLNETQFDFQIRTISDAMHELQADAFTNGDIEKLSKTGSLKFHKFWLKIRCPLLIGISTKNLTHMELTELHTMIYSVDQSSTKSKTLYKSLLSSKLHDESIDISSDEQNKSHIFTTTQNSNPMSSADLFDNSYPMDQSGDNSVNLLDQNTSFAFNHSFSDSDKEDIEMHDESICIEPSKNGIKHLKRKSVSLDSTMPAEPRHKTDEVIVIFNEDSDKEDIQMHERSIRIESDNAVVISDAISSDDSCPIKVTSSPVKLDMTRLSEVNEHISNVSRPQFDYSTNWGDEDLMPSTSAKISSAPNTPVKIKKTARIYTSPTKNRMKNLKRKSVSLNSSMPTEPRQKTDEEVAIFNEAAKLYDQMSKEELIKNCVQYGLKKSLGKRQMIIKLKEIHCEWIFFFAIE